MSERKTLSLFEAYGIEIEHMIVDRGSLDVRPIADELLRAAAGIAPGDDAYTMEVERGDIAWSNELALHVIEMKTNGPSPTLEGLAERFQANVARMNELLQPMHARVMPTAMHPWMDPHTEMRLWPHEDDAIYNAFHRIFDCRGHGWANLQSMHINLPFANDAELGRLHAAIRLLLPLLPAIAASSPFVEGKPTGSMDTRLDVYRNNARRIPSVSGVVIPERVFTRADYEREIFERIYADMVPVDPEGILRYEWVNARGCIARFDRMALEIRVLDTQEAPVADLAIAMAVVSALRALVEERHVGLEEQQIWDELELARLMGDCVRSASAALIDDERYLRVFGWPERGKARARDLWTHLIETTMSSSERPAALQTFIAEGSLAERLLDAGGTNPDRARLHALYEHLCACLAQGAIFHAADL